MDFTFKHQMVLQKQVWVSHENAVLTIRALFSENIDPTVTKIYVNTSVHKSVTSWMMTLNMHFLNTSRDKMPSLQWLPSEGHEVVEY